MINIAFTHSRFTVKELHRKYRQKYRRTCDWLLTLGISILPVWWGGCPNYYPRACTRYGAKVRKIAAPAGDWLPCEPLTPHLPRLQTILLHPRSLRSSGYGMMQCFWCCIKYGMEQELTRLPASGSGMTLVQQAHDLVHGQVRAWIDSVDRLTDGEGDCGVTGW